MLFNAMNSAGAEKCLLDTMGSENAKVSFLEDTRAAA